MNSVQTWVEALNISPEKLNEWSSQVPAGKPLLVWCLENGHVSAPDYFGWATDNFGLPVLSASYFSEMDRAYFDQHKEAGHWSPWLVPLQEWDGITYVACVEPPPERTSKTCYVLADPRAMAEVWGDVEAEIVQKSAKADLPPLPDQDQPPPVEAPEGIRLTPPKVPFKLNLDETNLLIGGIPEPEPPPPLDRAPAPEELTNLTSISTEATTVDEGVLQLDENLTGMTGMSLAPGTVVEAMPQVAPPPAPADSTRADMTVPTAIFHSNSGATDLNLPSSESDSLAIVFANLGRTYAHSCLIRFGDDGQARLYKVSPSLKPPGGGVQAVLNLSQPSFLRIVIKTLLPYHGYLVASPAHQEFFAHLGLSELPGCVTAAPLRVNGKLWGALLAMGPESLQAMDNLGMVASAADQLVSAIGTIWAKAA